MKKALIITHYSGFLLKFEADNVKILQHLGYEVHFASNIHEKGYDFKMSQLTEMGVLFHHIDIARSPYMIRMNVHALRQTVQIVKKEKVDLIHCHTPVGGILGRLAGALSGNPGIRVVYTAHGFHFYRGAPFINNTVYKWVESFMAHLTDVLVTINREDFQNAQSFRLKRGGRIVQIPGTGLDLSFFHPVSGEEKERMREKLQIPREDFVLLSVGELNGNKNHGMVLSALQKGRKIGLLGQGVRYEICGDGFLREKLEQRARDLHVEDMVDFCGYQCDIREYYGAADAMIFPSKREGLGMAALESLAMGLPVLASKNRGTREYMKDGENGYVYQYDDEEGLLDGIRKIKEMSRQQRQEMGQRGRESVRYFDKKYTDEKMFDVYKKLDEERTDEEQSSG